MADFCGAIYICNEIEQCTPRTAGAYDLMGREADEFVIDEDTHPIQEVQVGTSNTNSYRSVRMNPQTYLN